MDHGHISTRSVSGLAVMWLLSYLGLFCCLSPADLMDHSLNRNTVGGRNWGPSNFHARPKSARGRRVHVSESYQSLSSVERRPSHCVQINDRHDKGSPVHVRRQTSAAISLISPQDGQGHQNGIQMSVHQEACEGSGQRLRPKSSKGRSRNPPQNETQPVQTQHVHSSDCCFVDTQLHNSTSSNHSSSGPLGASLPHVPFTLNKYSVLPSIRSKDPQSLPQ